MARKLFLWLAVLLVLPLTVAADNLVIKSTAPEVYEVKKGDTLWDISSMYLDKPWLWPELWRTNTHISNPHLIYPGDQITLRFEEDGTPVLDVVREPQKPTITLSPQGKKLVKQPIPVGVVPWSVIQPFVENAEVLSEQAYQMLPYLLGNQQGAVRFASGDVVLSKKPRDNQQAYRLMRKSQEITDLAGNLLGFQVRHVGDADVLDTPDSEQVLVKLRESNFEAKRGDRLMNVTQDRPADMTFEPATHQQGNIVANLENYDLLGKFSVVVVDLGYNDVSAGTVMGIYQQGPVVHDAETPLYEHENNFMRSAFTQGEAIQQPAIKDGDLVIFKTFEKASYGLITKARSVIRTGAIVARP